MENNEPSAYPTQAPHSNHPPSGGQYPQHIDHSLRRDPLAAPPNSSRYRNRHQARDPAQEVSSSRKRIAVACGRCRKRKIRCSGNGGDGVACDSCLAAGIDPSLCQFYRVGEVESMEAARVLERRQELFTFPNPAATTPTTMLPLYNVAASPIDTRNIPTNVYHTPSPIDTRNLPTNAYNSVDTKSLGCSVWTSGPCEVASQIGSYHLDHPTAYSPHGTYPTSPYAYGGRLGYGFSGPRLPPTSIPVFDQNFPAPVNTALGLPYLQTEMKPAMTTEPLSPLNMTSLQMTLPEKPHQPKLIQGAEPAAPQRQLPIPQPNPAQVSRNTVDRMQDQRLRSTQVIGSSSQGMSSAYSRPTLPGNWDANGESPLTTSTELPPSNLPNSGSSSAQMLDAADNTVGYVPVTRSSHEHVAVTSGPAQPQYNFSTSLFLSNVSNPAPNSAYSDFRGSSHRDYQSRSSCSAASATKPAYQESNTSYYRFTKDNGLKRDSIHEDSSPGSMLVSGQTYSPLSQTGPQSPSRLGGRSHETRRNAPFTSDLHSKL